MVSTQRYLHRHTDFVEAVTGSEIYGTPVDAYVRVIYTRQHGENWRFCIGQCVFGTDAGGTSREEYPTCIFVSQLFRGITLARLLENLTGKDGLAIAPDLSAVRLPTTALPNWREEIVPSHATPTGTPARRFRVGIEPNAIFSEGQLIAYDQPYRASAELHAKEFLRLNPRDSLPRGELTIEVPDQRAAISFQDGRIAIAHATVPVRLVGAVNGQTIDITGDAVATVDNKTIRDAELWLLTTGNVVIDFVSTSQWHYKYTPILQDAAREEKLLSLILNGESEICEFKPWIDLNNDKASQLEKTVCAFSNQRGGTLFIGIGKEGDIEGIAGHVRRGEDVEAAVMAYADAVRKRLRETLKETRCFELSVVAVSGTPLIVVTVEKARDINFIIQSAHSRTAFIRHGATSMKLTPLEMKAMIQASFESR